MEFHTSLGRVRGRDLGDVVRLSRLPYALPPLGVRRFARPQAIGAWPGVVDATASSTVPPQLPSRLAAVMGTYPLEQSEDCLHLDVWIPKGAAQPMPVIVFIHGGAFMTGGGALPCYDGTELARRSQAIVVNLSYRLGALGFLAIEGLAPANLGLHDQAAALRFIRREIAGFGGDPANVTLIGQSAGAFSIAAFLALPNGRDLFDRAVVMSAPLGIPLQRAEETSPTASTFLEKLGVEPEDTQALAAVPVEDILRAQGALLRDAVARGEPDAIARVFMPVIDGDLIHAAPAEALAEAPPVWCPLVVGAAREELAAFWFGRDDVATFAETMLPQRFEETFPGRGPAMLAAYRARRASSSAFSLLVDLRTQLDFVAPSLALAARHAAGGGTTFAYMFDWQSPDPRIGACHCIELPFLFGNLDTWKDAPMLARAPADELAALSRMVQDGIAAFARTGDPARGTHLPWPAHRPDGPVLHFDRLASCHTEIRAA
jgi:para-nitrobenzyl esterase